MLYALWLEDVEDSLERRLPVREAHLARIKKAVEDGVVKVAGPFPKVAGANPAEVGFAGGLMVAEFPDAAAAERWILEDPYAKAGVFKRYYIQPFIQAFGPA